MTACQTPASAAMCLDGIPAADRCRPERWPTARDWMRFLGDLFCGPGGGDGGA